jgi:nicotinamide mononucleotide transporter
MYLLSIFDTLYQNVLDSSWIEAVAVLFGLLSVWYAKKENILVYPTGIINVLIYVYICLKVGLYADMGINFFYFIMSVYGWYKWSRKDENQNTRPIADMNLKEILISVTGTAIFFFILSFVLKNYTNSTVPYIDGFTTAVFIIGMWLMALKKIENWIYWIIGDVYKSLILTSFQFTVFLIIAIAGYLEWKRKLEESKARVQQL